MKRLSQGPKIIHEKIKRNTGKFSEQNKVTWKREALSKYPQVSSLLTGSRGGRLNTGDPDDWRAENQKV